MKRISPRLAAIAIAVIFFVFPFAVAYAKNSFSGEWRYVDYIGTSRKPSFSFDIKLTQSADGKIQGSYCLINQSENRIDCDADNEVTNITGRGALDGSSTEVHFYSFFGGKDGVAKLSMVGNDLIWQVTKNPNGDFFYGPYKVELKKMPDNNHRGERRVVIDRAYLYDSPSISSITNAYVIKGDYVKLLNISDDFKFWRIRYIRTNGVAMERWIDCNAIASCP